MNDKQFLQRMHKMVRETHWIKHQLTTILEYITEEDEHGRLECVTNPTTGRFEIGKMGYCIMGMVGHIAEMPNDEGYVFDVEAKLYKYPQAERVTRILWDNLPQGFRSDRFSSVEPSIDPSKMATDIELYNDSPELDRMGMLSFLEQCIHTYKPKLAKK